LNTNGPNFIRLRKWIGIVSSSLNVCSRCYPTTLPPIRAPQWTYSRGRSDGALDRALHHLHRRGDPAVCQRAHQRRREPVEARSAGDQHLRHDVELALGDRVSDAADYYDVRLRARVGGEVAFADAADG
jgi:hypothetical protein